MNYNCVKIKFKENYTSPKFFNEFLRIYNGFLSFIWNKPDEVIFSFKNISENEIIDSIAEFFGENILKVALIEYTEIFENNNLKWTMSWKYFHLLHERKKKFWEIKNKDFHYLWWDEIAEKIITIAHKDWSEVKEICKSIRLHDIEKLIMYYENEQNFEIWLYDMNKWLYWIWNSNIKMPDNKLYIDKINYLKNVYKIPEKK